MKRTYKIEVRDYHGASHCAGANYIVVDVIHRVIWAETIGNFNPLFCRYQKRRTLVHCDGGDLSDPFRRTPGDLDKLYIVAAATPVTTEMTA